MRASRLRGAATTSAWRCPWDVRAEIRVGGEVMAAKSPGAGMPFEAKAIVAVGPAPSART